MLRKMIQLSMCCQLILLWFQNHHFIFDLKWEREKMANFHYGIMANEVSQLIRVKNQLNQPSSSGNGLEFYDSSYDQFVAIRLFFCSFNGKRRGRYWIMWKCFTSRQTETFVSHTYNFTFRKRKSCTFSKDCSPNIRIKKPNEDVPMKCVILNWQYIVLQYKIFQRNHYWEREKKNSKNWYT